MAITTNDLVNKILADSPTVTVECKPLGIKQTRVIVEGDLGLLEHEVLAYAQGRIELAERAAGLTPEQKFGLLAIERDGKILRWKRGKKLSYCVWRPSFGSDAEYSKAVAGMDAATAGWQSICGIEFEYVAAKDTDDNLALGDVTFPVLRQAGGGSTVAMAFFPDDPLNERIVWVFDGFFGGSGFDPIGVIRHELGHVLGFRHEHIRPEAPDLFNPESTEHTVALSEYDPKSVMHYVSGNVGDPELKFTEFDKTGARQVYGGPNTEFSFAD